MYEIMLLCSITVAAILAGIKLVNVAFRHPEATKWVLLYVAITVAFGAAFVWLPIL